ncbi:hypothetical protein LTR16_010429, partial [Cryomyces antarcticus]
DIILWDQPSATLSALHRSKELRIVIPKTWLRHHNEHQKAGLKLQDDTMAGPEEDVDTLVNYSLISEADLCEGGDDKMASLSG